MEKFRTEKAIRKIPHTVGGVTYMVDEEYEIKHVVQPRDTDEIVARMLTIITFVVVTGAMTWSTVAIGNLLHHMAPAWVSYLVAVVYDLTWVACMGAEWLMRYDQKRVQIPRVAGWLALVVSVLAIGADGAITTGSAVIGTAGGVISVLAKGLWMVVMAISSRKLNPLDQAGYEQAVSAANADLALNAVGRRVARMKARALRERQALGLVEAAPHIAATQPFETPEVEVPAGKHQQVVYFIRNGDRVKIGTTSRLRKRVQSLSMRTGDVLMVLDGGQRLEYTLHQRFAAHRVTDTEWFGFVPEIREFLTQKMPGSVLIPVQPEPVRTTKEIKSGDPEKTPEQAPQPIRSSIRSRVEVRIASGTTDPDEIFKDIIREDPGANQETVRRIIRTVRTA